MKKTKKIKKYEYPNWLKKTYPTLWQKLKKCTTTKQECVELWYEVVKSRAQYKSEVSGIEGKQIGGNATLNAHHVLGRRGTLLLDLSNGICITQGEHFSAHSPNMTTSEEMRAKIYDALIQRGEDIDIIESITWAESIKENLFEKREYLIHQLEVQR